MIVGVLQTSSEGLIVLPSGQWFCKTNCSICKCRTLTYSHVNDDNLCYSCSFSQVSNSSEIQNLANICMLSVSQAFCTNPHLHIDYVVSKANRMLGLIKRTCTM